MENFDVISTTIDNDALFENVRDFFKFSAPYKYNLFNQTEGWTNFEVTRADDKTILVKAERFRVERDANDNEKFIPFDDLKPVCVIDVSKLADGKRRAHFRVYRDELAPHFRGLAESLAKSINAELVPAVPTLKITPPEPRAETTQAAPPAQPTQIAPPQKKRRRGGVPPTPEPERQKYIEGWHQAQANGESQEAYCDRIGFGTSTLRMWMRQAEENDSGGN